MSYDKPFEAKPNSGSLFANKSKAKPNSPDYSGDILIDIRAFEVVDNTIKVRLAGWKKVSKTGKQFLSLAASAPQEQSGQRSYGTNPVPQADEDCPF